MKKYLTTKNLGWLFTAIVAFMLGIAGVSKLIGTEEMVNNFSFMNLSTYLPLVGLAEIAAVVLLAIPKTSMYGAVLITALMSAAAVMHLSLMGGVGVATPIFIGLFAWFAHCNRTYTTCCSKEVKGVL
jgi:hypothetical protein